MKLLSRLLDSFACCLIIINLTSALYEDQIGKFDWRQQYVGKVTHAFFDTNTAGRKLVVGTERNVIALFNANNGALQWRYLLGSKSTLRALFPVDHGRFVSVSGSPAIARVWDIAGVLISEFPVSQYESPAFSSWAEKDGTLYSAEIGKNAGDQFELSISKYSLSTKSEESKIKVPAVWYKEDVKCEFIAPHIACLDEQSKAINFINTESPQDLKIKALLDFGIDYEPGVNNFGVTQNTKITRYLWIKTSGKLYIISIQEDTLSNLTVLESETLAFDVTTVTDNGIDTQYLAFLKPHKEGYSTEFFDLQNKRISKSLSGLVKLTSVMGKPDLGRFYAYGKSSKDFGFRYFISANDHAIFCGSSGENNPWSREESLASITTVEMVDFPVSETEASIEEEFSSGNGGILSNIVKRMTSQISQIIIAGRELLTHLNPDSKKGSSVSGDSLVRDRFGLHKMIVVLTSTGKIFGMETTSGKIIWKKLLKGVSMTNSALYIQRTTAHFPMEPQCVILASDQSGKSSVLYVFHPITGDPHSGSGYVHLNYRVQQAMLLSQSEETEFLKPLLFLDHSDALHVFPDTPAIKDYIAKLDNSVFIYSADRRSCLMRGFSVRTSTLEAIPIWQLQLCSGGVDTKEEITAIVPRKVDEKVFSQGRVLADRSVLYKYLNPNLVVVVVEGWNQSQKGYVNIYLLDVVSGAVVFSTIHRRVSGPVHVAHAENWVVYSYYNEKFRRNEMASLELFEGKEQSNSTAFSSFAAPQPMINRQAYIYPAYITALTDTFTEKGMASKHILVALSNGWIQELPRAFLDPRRPIVSAATPEMREEGTIPYVPELPVPPEAIINYNKTVAYVRAIHSTPSALESTSLVLSYGLDLFFTRVTPSKTFDVLKDDFEYFFISTVVLGLFIASYIAKRVASKKSLKQAWK